MNPENLSMKALGLFNSLPPDVQRQALMLATSHPDEEAVYLAALRSMPEKQRRRFLFSLSSSKWGI